MHKWTLYHLMAQFSSQTVYAFLHYARRGVTGVLPTLTEIVKMPIKKRFVGSKLFKVIVFGTNRKRLCDLLLVAHSNLGRISHDLEATAIHWSIDKKSPLRPYHRVINGFAMHGYDPQIRTRARFWYSTPTPSPKFHRPVFTHSQAIVLTNTPTNAQTDKQTPLKTSNVLRYATTLGQKIAFSTARLS